MLWEILTRQENGSQQSRAHTRRDGMQYVSIFSCHLGSNRSPPSPGTEPWDREDPGQGDLLAGTLPWALRPHSRPCWPGPCNDRTQEAAVTGQVTSSAQLGPVQLCTCFQVMQWTGPVYWSWKASGKDSIGIMTPHAYLLLCESHLCPGGWQQTASATSIPL